MNGRGSRDKGARGERELAAILREQLGVDAWRTPMSGAAFLPGDIAGVPGWHIEAKRCERWDLHAWIAQVERGYELGDKPLVIFRSNREPWRVCLALADFLPLIRRSEV